MTIVDKLKIIYTDINVFEKSGTIGEIIMNFV